MPPKFANPNRSEVMAGIRLQKPPNAIPAIRQSGYRSAREAQKQATGTSSMQIWTNSRDMVLGVPKRCSMFSETWPSSRRPAAGWTKGKVMMCGDRRIQHALAMVACDVWV